MNHIKTIAITNQKGGVGKTTTATNIATAFAAMGHNTLLIDLDPQGNATTSFAIPQSAREYGSYQLLQGIPYQQTLLPTKIPNLTIIPANVDLSAAEIDLVNYAQREFVLKKILAEVREYDYIIIDCPPSLGLLTINALSAADEILIPLQCEFFALEGLSHLLTTVNLVKKNLNSRIKILGVLLTMYDKRNKLTEQVEQDVRTCLGQLVLQTVIPRNVRVSEAPSHGLPVMLYDQKCIGAISYMGLANEVIAKMGA